MMRIASVFSKLKRPLAGAALLLMAGCAGGQAADVQDAAADDVAVQSAAAATEFTTADKLTRTIETPWGPREVYDPAQDPQVKAAFERIYNRDEGVVHKEYFVVHPSQGGKETYVLKDALDDFDNQVIMPNGMVQNILRPRTPDADDLIVMQSLIEQRLDYLDLKCQKIKENNCTITHIYQEDCLNGAPCYRVKQTGGVCPSPIPNSVGGLRGIYNNMNHPIGKKFFAMRWALDGGIQDPPAPLDYDAQLENYFFVKCLGWKKER